ncbi:hypothetical protein Zmor_023661 [Zophobas morio]|uniref:Uncharacterized protein n=1 Tax=Zophobas morio TaxID=2755281 RepID=A0AA38HYL8_9CUCU|nr:hypothetical protein Zmor_023661 [Zophobas morio]
MKRFSASLRETLHFRNEIPDGTDGPVTVRNLADNVWGGGVLGCQALGRLVSLMSETRLKLMRLPSRRRVWRCCRGGINSFLIRTRDPTAIELGLISETMFNFIVYLLHWADIIFSESTFSENMSIAVFFNEFLKRAFLRFF